MSTVLISLLTLVGAFSTFVLAQQHWFNAIRASSILTILFYFVLVLAEVDADFWATVFFGGTFIGMSAPHKVSYFALVISSLCFSSFFILLIPYLNGIGGALGCSAFISVVISQVLRTIGKKCKTSVLNRHQKQQLKRKSAL